MGWHPRTCLAEVFQAKRRIDLVSRAPLLVGFETVRSLRLLDLTGLWPTRVSVHDVGVQVLLEDRTCASALDQVIRHTLAVGTLAVLDPHSEARFRGRCWHEGGARVVRRGRLGRLSTR